MHPATETTLLMVLGLICVAILVLLPIKEDEDASGIRVGIQARAKGFHHCGEPRQVSKQMTLDAADAQQGRSRGTVATVLSRRREKSRGLAG